MHSDLEEAIVLIDVCEIQILVGFPLEGTHFLMVSPYLHHIVHNIVCIRVLKTAEILFQRGRIETVIGIEHLHVFTSSQRQGRIDARAVVAIALVDDTHHVGPFRFERARQFQCTVMASVIDNDRLDALVARTEQRADTAFEISLHVVGGDDYSDELVHILLCERDQSIGTESTVAVVKGYVAVAVHHSAAAMIEMITVCRELRILLFHAEVEKTVKQVDVLYPVSRQLLVKAVGLFQVLGPYRHIGTATIKRFPTIEIAHDRLKPGSMNEIGATCETMGKEAQMNGLTAREPAGKLRQQLSTATGYKVARLCPSLMVGDKMRVEDDVLVDEDDVVARAVAS